MPAHLSVRPSPEPYLRSVWDGIRLLLRDSTLRAVTLTAAVIWLFLLPFESVVLNAYLNESGQEAPGSPLVILEAIREAEVLVNVRQDRRKLIQIDVELICIDDCSCTLDYLRHVLEDRGYGGALATGSIKLVEGKFADHCAASIQRARDRSPRSGRALFVLDQYGYSSVPMDCLRDIFGKLKHAEVILTFYIDSLINYLNEKNLAGFELSTGINSSVRAADLDEIKQSPRWRVQLQSSLYQSLTSQCSAQFYTPFFIRPERGHGDFWLLHLSQHWKARDVMATTHWRHHNHFAHYGKAVSVASTPS